MRANFIVGACIALLGAAPVLGAEGNGSGSVKLAKFIEQSAPLPIERSSAPRVTVKENFKFYDIDGSTPDELRAQMKRNGTAWNDGKVYAALTTWDMHYNYDITGSDGSYHLDSIKTDVDIEILLPRLAPAAKASELMASTWNTYLGNLKRHEFGHRDIAVGIGEEIYQALSALGSNSSKSQLDHEAQSIIKAKFKKLKQSQIDYDQQTHHGKNQGADLPDHLVAASAPAS
jgi:predicted secreted Zn-dependent protease